MVGGLRPVYLRGVGKQETGIIRPTKRVGLGQRHCAITMLAKEDEREGVGFIVPDVMETLAKVQLSRDSLML